MSTHPDAIDAESTALVVRGEYVEEAKPRANLAMLDADTPEEFMDRISRVCKILVDVVEKQNLSKKLGRGDKRHVELEAWQFLASMPWIRCSAVIEWTKEIGNGEGWEARALVYRDGQVVGAGEGMCLKTESNWRGKDFFSLRSMAQTRALSRALQRAVAVHLRHGGLRRSGSGGDAERSACRANLNARAESASRCPRPR